jgi:Tol biopolymer transport system component
MIGDVSGSAESLQVSNIRKILFTVPGDEYNGKWSPRISVSRVAYEYQTSATATDHDVWVIDPFNNNNNVNFYNPNNSGYPAWAPACDRIIFESDKSNGDFWKIVSLGYPSNNGQPSDIAAEANIHLRYPTWLPNGGLIAYIKLNAAANGNIWMVSSSGGSAFKLLQSQPQFDAANNLWPAW